MLFTHGTKPAMQWLLQHYAQPAYGAAGVGAVQQLLAATHQALWLAPVYLVTLMVSCIW
jgi:hypothetical protein